MAREIPESEVATMEALVKWKLATPDDVVVVATKGRVYLTDNRRQIAARVRFAHMISPLVKAALASATAAGFSLPSTQRAIDVGATHAKRRPRS